MGPTSEELRYGRIEMRTVFQTEDGKVFDSLESAQHYDSILAIADAIHDELPELAVLLDAVDRHALAEWILQHFNRKET